MRKHTRKTKVKDDNRKEENLDIEDLPEHVLEILSLLGTAAITMIVGNQPGAFSGRHGDFIFSLIYDPSNEIDQDTYSSAIVEIIKKIDPSAICIDIPSPFSENDETL